MRKITRRHALKNLGALAGAAAVGPRLLGGCSSDGGGDDGPQGITTIVTLMMENRSYDHYLGSRKLLDGLGGDGLVAGMANPDLAGMMQPIHHADVACVADPPHGWDSSRVQFDNGLNDGFLAAYQTDFGPTIPPHVMGYLTRPDIPVTHALADAYTSCDRWFGSLLGPTWPNRMYLHSAQSNGRTNNDYPDTDAGFSWPIIYDRLNDAGVPWNYYYGDLPFVALWQRLGSDRIKRLNYDFFDDAFNGTLPPVVFLDPAFSANDDHPPHHPIFGQQLIASVYAALATSPQWKNILFVVTYDENGGFFDHVPPPKMADERAVDGFDQTGFRVPTLITGPYVKPGYVSSTVYDHTSVLKHIENMFGLPPLTQRDAAANDLSDAIDMTRLAANDPAPPVELPEIVIDESMIDDACTAMPRVAPTEIETLADTGFFPHRMDLRHETRDLLFSLGETLDKLNRGGIRKGR